MPSVKADVPAEISRPLIRRSGWSLRDVWSYVVQLVSVGIFFGGGVVMTVLALIVRPVLGAERSRIVGRKCIRRLFQFFAWWLEVTGMCRVQYHGIEKLETLRGAIVAPNHPGLLDAVFLIPRLPRAVCIMRAGLMRNPSFVGAALLAGFIANDRGSGLIRQCERKLRAGDNLLIFPEGTRTRLHARGVNPFKGGFALAAVLTGAPIQTVLIERSGAYLAKETSLGAAAEVPVCMSIRLGEIFYAQPGESAKALSARLEAYFRESLENTGAGIRLAQ